MKRFAFLIAVLVLVTSILTSCIIPFYKNFRFKEDRVASIEVYDLCQCKNTEGPYFLETESPVYEIPEETLDDFLTDLAEIRFSDALVLLPIPQDPSFGYDTWTLRINYIDGSYQLLSNCGYGQTFDARGEITDTHHFSCDREEWEALIGKYLPEEAFQHRH